MLMSPGVHFTKTEAFSQLNGLRVQWSCSSDKQIEHRATFSYVPCDCAIVKTLQRISDWLVFQNWYSWNWLKQRFVDKKFKANSSTIKSFIAYYFCSEKTHLSFRHLKTHLSSFYKERHTLIFGTILFTSWPNKEEISPNAAKEFTRNVVR